MLTAKQLERAIEAERDIWESWLTEVVRIGPGADDATAALVKSSARFTQLESIYRSYFHEDYMKALELKYAKEDGAS